ncbi:MAG: hypothetical protein LLG06_18540, partial [Desulfobacteraceae bacterium]|nr:hypothetical protein [Desulfobacteraceae bacterium]
MDNYAKSDHNTFVAETLDRAHNRRKSEEWIAGRLNDPGARFVPIWNARVLVDGSAAPRTEPTVDATWNRRLFGPLGQGDDEHP